MKRESEVDRDRPPRGWCRSGAFGSESLQGGKSQGDTAMAEHLPAGGISEMAGVFFILRLDAVDLADTPRLS